MRPWLTREYRGAPYWLLVLLPLVLVLGAALILPAVLRPAPAASGPVTTYTARPPATTAPLTVPADPRLLVFGDSYTEGFAASPMTSGYAHLIGTALGWPTQVLGVGGTGFTFGGTGGGDQDYGTRLRAYIASGAAAPNVIVLEGSQNDYRAVGKITAAVEADVALLRQAYPGVRIVLFGPAAPQPLLSDLGPIDAADSAAADALGIPYISPYQGRWFTAANSKRYAHSDGSHLNTAGHAYLAERFLADFRPLFGL